MSANLNKIPAGITNGTEAFWLDGEKWLIHNGEAKPFNQFPTAIQNQIVDLFANDTQSRSILQKHGIKGFSQQFDTWYKCVVGGLDNTPDFTNWQQLTADSFANTCPETNCPMRGKLCGRAMALNNIEVDTIRFFAKGYTIGQVAKEQFVTEAAIKSRLNTIHYKTQTRNMASLMVVATVNGVIQ